MPTPLQTPTTASSGASENRTLSRTRAASETAREDGPGPLPDSPAALAAYLLKSRKERSFPHENCKQTKKNKEDHFSRHFLRLPAPPQGRGSLQRQVENQTLQKHQILSPQPRCPHTGPWPRSCRALGPGGTGPHVPAPLRMGVSCTTARLRVPSRGQRCWGSSVALTGSSAGSLESTSASRFGQHTHTHHRVQVHSTPCLGEAHAARWRPHHTRWGAHHLTAPLLCPPRLGNGSSCCPAPSNLSNTCSELTRTPVHTAGEQMRSSQLCVFYRASANHPRMS